MKTSHYFRSLFLALILLIFTQTIIAQSWENYNPLGVYELELSDEQKTQLQEINKNYFDKIREIRKTPRGDKDLKEHYEDIREKRNLLQIKKENAQKLVLIAHNDLRIYLIEVHSFVEIAFAFSPL